jgi:hypothetical protein
MGLSRSSPITDGRSCLGNDEGMIAIWFNDGAHDFFHFPKTATRLQHSSKGILSDRCASAVNLSRQPGSVCSIFQEIQVVR